MGTGRRRQPRVELVEAAPGTHRGDGRGQPALRRRGVVHVVGGDAGEVVARRQLGQRIVARRVERIAVIPQLHHHPVAPEQLDQPLQFACAAAAGPCVDQRRRHGTLAAPGEHPTVTAHRVGDVEQRELRRALLPGQMAEAQAHGPGAHSPWARRPAPADARRADREHVIRYQTGGDLLLRVVFAQRLTGVWLCQA